MKGLLAALLLLVLAAGGASAAAGLTPELAFSAQGDIWVGNADGSGLVRLDAAGDDTSPVWSPDGSRIAFTAIAADGVSRLTVMNADGTGRRVVDVGVVSNLAWSRDGRRIAFVRPTTDGRDVEVRVADANGSGSVPVTTIQSLDAPDWTADGRLVVAVPTSGVGAVLRSIDPDTRQSFRIDDGGWPSVSPDGTQVAYVSTTRPPTPAVYVAGVDGVRRPAGDDAPHRAVAPGPGLPTGPRSRSSATTPVTSSTGGAAAADRLAPRPLRRPGRERRDTPADGSP